MASTWIYAARRLALAVPLLLGMSVLVFWLMRFVPGDPAVVVLGYKATPEGVRALREAFHLDEPLPEQYLRWLAGLVRGDFGVDFRQNEPIGRMILDRLPVTLELTILASVGAALIGIPLGLLGGARRRGFADRATLAIGLIGVSIPDFWLGINADARPLAGRRATALRRLRPDRRELPRESAVPRVACARSEERRVVEDDV